MESQPWFVTRLFTMFLAPQRGHCSCFLPASMGRHVYVLNGKIMENHGETWENYGKPRPSWPIFQFLVVYVADHGKCVPCFMCSLHYSTTSFLLQISPIVVGWFVFFPISKVLNPYMKSPLKPCTGRGRKLRLGPSGSSALPAGELGRSMVLGAVRSHWGFMRCNPFEEGLCGNESLDG